MYNKILAALDGSTLAEQILPYARLFAEAYGTAVELLRVEDPDARPPFWPPQPGADYFKEISTRYFPPSLRVDRLAESGKPAQVIVERAQADPSCLIAMTTHGLSGMRRWLLGSVASRVVQSAANPVLLIRAVDEPAAEICLKTVLVPLDGSALAERILPHIISLAKKMKLAVELVRVNDSPADAYPAVDAIYLDALNRHREAARREAESYLEEKAQALRAEGLDRVTSRPVEGNPAEKIIELARNTPHNLVAMSTHGRSGVGRWVIGSIAEKVIQYSQDPVLIVRPGAPSA
jgi:nucleotide-binding universal stress UspA family protein